ncbi:hypothetical protein MRB53_042336 [Persea americana]|nr:hypothetical protein MRB53_042336 [Persea americana]
MDGKRKRSLRARRDIEERRTSSRNISRMSYDEQDTTASELSDFASYVQNYARIYSRNPELNDQDSLRLLERSGSPSSASDVVDGQPRARKRNKSNYSSNGDKTSARQSRDTDDSSVSPKSSPKKRKHQDDAKGRLVSPRAGAEALLQAEIISISSTDPDDIQERSHDAAEDQGHNSDNDNAGESRHSIATAETLVDAEPLNAQQAPRPAYTQMKWHSLASVSFSLSSGSPAAASKSVSPKPNVRRPAASQPNSAESDVRQPAASRSDSAQPSVHPSAASQANSPQQDVRRPAASQANSVQPDVHRPAASNSPSQDLHRPAASQSDSVQQDLRQPATQQLNSGQPNLRQAAAPPATQPARSMKGLTSR